MKYLHTMVRVTDIQASLAFYCDALGLQELRRYDSEEGRFTLVFLAAKGNESAQVELTRIIGIRNLTQAGETSATWPIRWKTSTPHASGWWITVW